MPNKPKKLNKEQQMIQDLTADLQRTRADFENYRKRVDFEKSGAKELGKITTILDMLPIIDNIERAIGYIPDHLKDDQWALGICSLSKNLEKTLADLGLKKIDSKPGVKFNPELHEAVQFDEATEGEHEVIAEELQPGYLLGDKPLRHAMVRVTRQ